MPKYITIWNVLYPFSASRKGQLSGQMLFLITNSVLLPVVEVHSKSWLKYLPQHPRHDCIFDYASSPLVLPLTPPIPQSSFLILPTVGLLQVLPIHFFCCPHSCTDNLTVSWGTAQFK